MGKNEEAQCPWCMQETKISIDREKSDFGKVLVRRCHECKNIISSYLEEDRPVLKRVRSFSQ